MTDPRLASRMVSWWCVHEYVTPFLEKVGSWPVAGSPAWCLLDDDDPIKLAGLLDFAQHWALRVETCQHADCEAFSEVSLAADWAHIAQYLFKERCFFDAHPWLKRKTS